MLHKPNKLQIMYQNQIATLNEYISPKYIKQTILELLHKTVSSCNDVIY